MLPLGVLYESVTRPTAKKSNKVLGLELLERDLERGKPLFRRKRGKTRNLDGSGHKGLADLFRIGSIRCLRRMARRTSRFE